MTDEVPPHVLAIEQWQEEWWGRYGSVSDIAADIRREARDWQEVPAYGYGLSESASRWVPEVGWVPHYASIAEGWEEVEEAEWRMMVGRIRNRQRRGVSCPTE